MGNKKRNNKRISSSEEDDDDEDNDSESEDSDNSPEQKKENKRKGNMKIQTRQQTQSKNELQIKKRVQIMEQEREPIPEKRRSQYRKPTAINKLRRSQEEDEDKDQNEELFDVNDENDQDDYNLGQGRRKGEGRRKGPSKTIIATENLEQLKNKAKKLDEQNMVIENLEQQLEQKQKQVLILNLEQQQDKEEKDKNIQSLATQKQMLEKKVGIQSNRLKKVKEELNLRRGSLFSLQLERRNSAENEELQTSSYVFEHISLPIDLQQWITKKTSIITKLVNYLQYNYPMSKSVHTILNYYTKNEELHFTYISVYFNLSLIIFILYLPFIILQIIGNYTNFDSSKPISFMMYHEFIKSYVPILVAIFACFILIHSFILFYRVLYVRKKDVESEAQSQKDLNNFKLVFSSINFRLSDLGNSY